MIRQPVAFPTPGCKGSDEKLGPIETPAFRLQVKQRVEIQYQLIWISTETLQTLGREAMNQPAAVPITLTLVFLVPISWEELPKYG